MTKPLKYDSIQGYLTTRGDSLVFQIEKLQKNFNPSNLHKLRTEIKKFLFLCEFLSGFRGKSKAVPFFSDELKNLQKHSGRLREFQVSLDMILKPHSGSELIPAYKSFMEDKIKKETGMVKKILNDFNATGFIPDCPVTEINPAKFTHEILLKKTQKIILKRIKKISMLAKSGQNDTNLHEIRKHIKFIIEITNLPGMPENFQVWKDREAYMKKLAARLGKSHDIKVLNGIIRQFFKLSGEFAGKKKSADRELFIKKYKKRNEQLREEILELVNGLSVCC